MSEYHQDPFFLRWDFIGKIASNELSKVVGIIPLAGYIILFNDKILESISFNWLAGFNDEEASTFLFGTLLKMRLIFFGSLSLLLANLAYKTSSPKVLSFSNSEFEFSDRVISSYSLLEIKNIEEKIRASTRDWKTPLITKNENFLGLISSEKSRSSGYRDKASFLSSYDEYLRVLAREWWHQEMDSRSSMRWLIFSLAISGYCSLSISTFDIIQAVVRDLV